jgi:hypothetical protein
MSTLPKLLIPHYTVTCPSGLSVTFRPFLVKEEKLLLVAGQSQDTETILSAAKQVLENCVEHVDIDKLPIFDVEFLFLNLRARSIGENLTLKYKCNRDVVDANTGNTVICNAVSEYPVDLLAIKPSFAAGHNKYIEISDTVGMTLRYPTFKSFRVVSRKELPAEEAFEFLVGCIESINDSSVVVFTKDVPPEEVVDFVDHLSKQQMKKIDHFFDTMPKIELPLAFKCPKCQYEETLIVRGLDSFFVES